MDVRKSRNDAYVSPKDGGLSDGNHETQKTHRKLCVVGEPNLILRSEAREDDFLGQAYLPGVLEERRFHVNFPDVLVPNGLLREHLREDHALRHSHSNLQEASTRQIANGYARGLDRGDLCPCMVAMSSDNPFSLKHILYSPGRIQTTQEGRVNILEVPFAHPWTYVQTSLQAAITDISFASGAPFNLLGVLTRIDLGIFVLEFSGGRRTAALALRKIFSVGDALLKGARPVCFSIHYGADARLAILDSEGVLRIYINKKPSVGEFSLVHLSNGLHAELLDLTYCPLRLTNDIYVCIGTQLSRFSYEDDNSIVLFECKEAEHFLQLELHEPYVVILTNKRVCLLDQGISQKPALSWKHNLSRNTHYFITVCSTGSNIQILLFSRLYHLCIHYTFDKADPGRSTSPPRRITFCDKSLPTFAVVAVLSRTRHTPSLISILYMTKQFELYHLLLADDCLEVIEDRYNCRIYGPALVPEAMMDDEESGKVNSTKSSKMRRIGHTEDEVEVFDLSHCYFTLIRHTGASERRSASHDQYAYAQSSQLGHEMSVPVIEGDDYRSSYLEQLASTYHDLGQRVQTVPGLSIYNNNEDTLDDEAYTPLGLSRLMQAWLGSGPHTNQLERDRRAEGIHTSAKLLSESTILFNPSIRSTAATEDVRLADLCLIPKRPEESPAMNKILSEWQVDVDPSSYRWRNIDSDSNYDAEPPTLLTVNESQFTPQAPPEVVSRPIEAPFVVSSTQPAVAFSQTGDSRISMTQPIAGKFGTDRKRKKKTAGF